MSTAGLAETQEQRELASAVTDALDTVWSEADLSAFLAAGGAADPDVVSTPLAELGLAAATLGEDDGGLGLGWLDLVTGLERLGARLAPTDVLESAVATELLSGAGPLLAEHVAGTRPAAAVLTAPASAWGVASDVTIAHPADGGDAGATPGGQVRLSGTVAHVPGGRRARVLVLALGGPGGEVVVALDADAAGLTRTPLEALDLLRGVDRLELADVPARVVAAGPAARAAVARATAVAVLVLAAEQVGAAERCLTRSVAHASERMQFGQPIGSFQAVRHRCAEMLVQVELARSAVRKLAAALDLGDERWGTDVDVALSLAKVRASRALTEASRAYLQILGAMGFTWEVDAHLAFRKAGAGAAMLGSATAHRRALGRHLGLLPEENTHGTR